MGRIFYTLSHSKNMLVDFCNFSGVSVLGGGDAPSQARQPHAPARCRVEGVASGAYLSRYTKHPGFIGVFVSAKLT